MFNDRVRALARRDALTGALVLAALLVVTHHDVVFLGRSLIATNYSNPLDWRAMAVSGASLLGLCALAFAARFSYEARPASAPRTTSAAP